MTDTTTAATHGDDRRPDARGEGVADQRCELLVHRSRSSVLASRRSCSPTARTVCASSARAPTTSASATACRRRASRPRSALGSSWDVDLVAPRRRGARRRDLDRERRGPARPRRQHQALAAVRPQLRVLLRGPDRLGRAGRRDRERHPVEGRGHVAQALRGQQPGERPDAASAPTSTRARCARSTCAASSGSSRRAAVDRDVLLQPDQRRLRLGGPVAADRRAARRVGLRRARRVGLGRGQRARAVARRRPGPRDAVARAVSPTRRSSPR